MQTSNSSHLRKQQVLLTCLVLGPLFQLIGDSLWVTHDYPYSWSIWREASYLFLIPAGILLFKKVEGRSVQWAIIACALYITGCFGSATMMPLFRLGAFYPIERPNEFPAIVQTVLDKKLFAASLFLPGLCFPVSLVLFGFLFLRYRLLPAVLSVAFCVSGMLFWIGNAGEVNAILVIGDALLLVVFCWFGYVNFSNSARADLSLSTRG